MNEHNLSYSQSSTALEKSNIIEALNSEIRDDIPGVWATGAKLLMRAGAVLVPVKLHTERVESHTTDVDKTRILLAG